MVVLRDRKKTSIDQHPLFIGLLVGIVGAAAGYFAAIKSAQTQADAVIKAAQLQIEQDRREHEAKIAEEEKNREFNPNSGSSKHTIIVAGVEKIIDSKYEDGVDYWIRSEGCQAEKTTTVLCTFTVLPKKTITVTNVDNNSRGYRRDGSTLVTCCLYANDETTGVPVYAPGDTADKVKRYTIQPGEPHIFALRIPDFAKGSLPDSVLFSRGQNDKGVEFSIPLSTLHWGTKISISDQYRDVLFNSQSDGVIGNKSGGQVVVEFIDYQCQSCKQAEPELQKFLAAHSDIKLIVKDLPILDRSGSPPVSRLAAVGALAAASQGRFAEVRSALLNANHLTKTGVLRILAANGVATDKLSDLIVRGAFNTHLTENADLAKNYSITGVPVFIYNGRIYLGLDEFISDYTISAATE